MSDFQDIAVPIGVGIGAWFAAAPDLATIRARDPQDRADLRMIEILVAVLTLGTGLSGSVVTKSKGPFLASVLTLATIFTAYEINLRAEGSNHE